jgi:Spy/CpxP family protein refolding chaperone
MKTWKKVPFALGLAFVVAGATAAVAAHGYHGGNFQARITARVNRMLDKLNATPEQRQAINQVKDDALAKLQQQRQQHAQDRGFWMQALTADAVDVDQLNAKADQHAADMAKTAKTIIIPALVKVHDILTPAQRQQLATMMKDHAPQGGFGGPEQ